MSQAAVESIDDVQAPGAVASSPAHQRILVVGIIAALAVAIVAVGGVVAVTSRHRLHPLGSSSAIKRAPVTPKSSDLTATLPVHVLTRVDANGSALKYPQTVTVRLPRIWADKVAAYGVVGTVLLAPAGWTQSKRVTYVAEDGGTEALLHATGSSAVAGQLNYESEDTGPAVWAAAPYLSWVRADWRRSSWPGGSPPAHARAHGTLAGPRCRRIRSWCGSACRRRTSGERAHSHDYGAG